MERSERAVENFKKGYNCAQSVFLAFADLLGLEPSQAAKLASSFGAGFGGLRQTCGTVTATFAIAGALYGYDTPGDLQVKTEHYRLVRSLAEKFQEKEGTICCSELLASLPYKLQQDPMPRTEEYYKVRPCVRFVKTASQILEELIAEQGVKG